MILMQKDKDVVNQKGAASLVRSGSLNVFIRIISDLIVKGWWMFENRVFRAKEILGGDYWFYLDRKNAMDVAIKKEKGRSRMGQRNESAS